jgi:hypothetical protein
MAAAVLSLALTAVPISDPIQIGPKTYESPISLYQGRHYVPQDNDERLCIRQRESKHDYRAVSATGRYRGAYQFSPELGVGAGWMIQRELKRQGVPDDQAEEIGRDLRAHPVNQWAPVYQDMAFWLVWNDGEGRGHWNHTVPGTGCW